MDADSQVRSVDLLARWHRGDQSAATEIFDRYVLRLVRLARSRISRVLNRRIDPEDVVQSAYRSFFRRSRLGAFQLQRSGDLWRLLAAITIRKTLGAVDHHRAAKRSASGEESVVLELGVPPGRFIAEPSIDESLVLTEVLTAFMESLGPVEQRIIELRLQERSAEEIALDVTRSPRTVRRILERLQKQLLNQLRDLED